MCKLLCMATNLAIDDRLIEDARRLAGLKTKKETVTQALQEFIQRRQQLSILGLFGEVAFDPTYNHKAQRRRK